MFKSALLVLDRFLIPVDQDHESNKMTFLTACILCDKHMKMTPG